MSVSETAIVKFMENELDKRVRRDGARIIYPADHPKTWAYAEPLGIEGQWVIGVHQGGRDKGQDEIVEQTASGVANALVGAFEKLPQDEIEIPDESK
jgi:hypothetical protein